MEPFEQWLFQQRDAFWSFFGEERPPKGKPHITDIVPRGVEIRYPVRGDLNEQIINQWHTRPSIGISLTLKQGAKSPPTFVAAPDDKGIFIINGQSYYVPFQRVVWNSSPRVEEYRRIDHVLVDGWNRCRFLVGKKAGEEDAEEGDDSESMESERPSLKPRSELQELRSYLFNILSGGYPLDSTAYHM